MATSTKFRTLAKLIDAVSMPFWVVDSDGRLVFLSGAVGEWLGVEPESLLGRQCVAGANISDDPLDFLAASLSAPPGFSTRGSSSLLIQPTSGETKGPKPNPLDTRFIRLGDSQRSLTFAIAGDFADQSPDLAVDASVTLRQQLDSWRRHHDALATTALMGTSRQATRMRTQANLASQLRTHVAIVSPPGCQADSVSSWVHQRSAPGESIANIDGPLMDPELLDASLGVVSQHLLESDHATATAILHGADETPTDAQARLRDWIDRTDGRLRLIAIMGPHPVLARQQNEETESGASENIFVDDALPSGLDVSLADVLCGLTITLHPLASRVDDIPMIATAMLDRRRASGDANANEMTADRFTRATLDALVLYPWPDNLLELDQAIRHASRVCRAQAISVEHFPLAIRSYRPNETVPVAKRSVDLDRAIARYESELIRQTLEDTDGNRAEAARRLNISRARLLRKLEVFEQEGNDG